MIYTLWLKWLLKRHKKVLERLKSKYVFMLQNTYMFDRMQIAGIEDRIRLTKQNIRGLEAFLNGEG